MVNVPRVKSLILHILLLFSLVGMLLILGCSTSKKNFFSKTWHNTTAHYNSYFIANEDIALVEATIAQSHKNNYSKILGVFYDIDSATIDGVRDKLDDVIKKASLPIQNHDNSDWVYPSYYLIGKARYYGGDFVNAIETFKYINKNGEEDDIRQKALVALMRAFISANQRLLRPKVICLHYLIPATFKPSSKMAWTLSSWVVSQYTRMIGSVPLKRINSQPPSSILN